MRPSARWLVVACFLALTCTARADEKPSGFLFRTLKSGDKEFRYTLYVPKGYDSGKKWPAIVFLHGAGECGTDGVKQVAQGIGSAILWSVDRWPFVVIFPQKPVLRDQWEQYDEQVMAMLAGAEKDLNIDRARVYLTGLSQGGHGTWALAARHPDVWAAAAPICGYGDPSEIGPKLKDLPIWAFHGDADTTVPLRQSQGLVDAVKAAGGTPKLTVYPGVGHNSWDKAYREENLADWFLQHTNPHAKE